MGIVTGEKAAHKRLNPAAANLSPLSLAAAVSAAALVVPQASFRFPSLVAGNNLNLGESLLKDGAEGAFRAGDHCVEQLRCLPVLKNSKDQEK